MEAWIAGVTEQLPLIVLLLVIAVSLTILVKGADILADQAISLSVRWGVPKVLIGATILSIATTLPEAAVSVLAAIQGAPGLALGNAVGSIILNTGLILGLAAIMGQVPVDQRLVNRQSWMKVSSAVLHPVSHVEPAMDGRRTASPSRRRCIPDPSRSLLLVVHRLVEDGTVWWRR